ncbi:hypothetical protein KI387_027908 [Taxus chinensis]|uniref:Uncharacterized protein n=1 Tax=Taxus chinensis TaxID=29808 RepID=A0AA38L2P2_TAXCH|nr:hypothetical protein KI387_027908 [Taxus chinensis]
MQYLGPLAALIIAVGNSAVTIGLWPAHAFWTYYCLARTRQVGPILKAVTLISLVVPIILVPITVILGSILLGLGYGLVTPLMATFEAVGEGEDKFIHCFVDGTLSTVEGSCTVVRDFTDVCFHSYFSFMDELRDQPPKDGRPLDIKLSDISGYQDFRSEQITVLLRFEVNIDSSLKNSACWKHDLRFKALSPRTVYIHYRGVCFYSMRRDPIRIVARLPGCVLAGLLGVILDVPIITLLAVCKAPYMLLKGWHRLLHDLIGREGPFLDTACVPFAGLAILFWPLAVMGSVLAAFLSSIFLGLYGAVVVYQEASIQLGLSYIVCAIALFDEYSNDLLHMREGSCFPRPEYRHQRKSFSGPMQTFNAPDKENTGTVNSAGNSIPKKRAPERTKSLKRSLKELKSLQMWDRLFNSCEFYGRALVRAGVIRLSDIEDWISTGKSRILNVGLPAYSILQSLLHSVKFDSSDFLLSDGVELTKSDRAEDRVVEWFFHPLMIMKEQIQAYKLEESESLYLSKLVLLGSSPERMEAWKNGGIPPKDEVKKAELEGLSRRLQGIATSLSRMPTFRRRFQNVVKVLYQEATVGTQIRRLSTARSLPTVKSENKLGRKQEPTKENQATNQCNDNSV